MKRQRIYVDTSVIGGCFDKEFGPWSRGLMEDFQRGQFQAVLSEIVAAEILPATEHVKEEYAKLLELGPEFVHPNEEVRQLAAAYQTHKIVPDRFSNDALHVALATVADVDLVVSWNFKHIVRFDKIRMFNAVNQEWGYKKIEIYSPREVTTYGKRD